MPLCRCCRRVVCCKERALCADCAVCLHCECQPSVNALGLCARCSAVSGIRRLYVRSAHWTPEWEQHLRRKTAEIQRALRMQQQRRSISPTAPR